MLYSNGMSRENGNHYPMPTRVLVVDDHTLFRQGLISLLSSQKDFSVAGEASSVREAIEKSGTLTPDMILLDINLPDGSGLDAIRQILSLSPASKVVLLTVYESDDFLLIALANGAKGYIFKTMPVAGLLAALRGVRRGEAAITRVMADRILDEYSRLMSTMIQGSSTVDVNQLSQRELEVLHLLGAEATNRSIAERLFISEHTVKIHVHHILDKLNLTNRREAAKFARRRGYNSLPPDFS